MKFIFATAAIVVLSTFTDSTAAKAGLLDDVMSVPRAVVNVRLNRIAGPMIDLSQTIPSAHDLRAFPRPKRNRVLRSPVEFIRYGMNIYPGTRTLRHNGFLRF